ncbi:MAG: hypothetical protein FWJ87_12020 [Micromonosporaceae bacterium]
MSTESSARQRVAVPLSLALGIAVLMSGGLLLREYGPGNMGNGFLAGGLIAIAVAGLSWWRSTTRPHTATTFERAFTLTGDERDDAVLTRALAHLGVCTLPLTGVAAAAIAVGAPVHVVLALLMFGQLAVVTVAFVVINRRN